MDALAPDKADFKQAIMSHLDAMHAAHSYRALSSGGLVIGSSSKAKVKIANTITYLHAGQFKSKSTAEVAFTATTHDIAFHASLVKEAIYMLCLDASGTASLVMGAVATGAGKAQLPELPAGLTPVGHVRVAVAAGNTKFTAATDELDAAHLTVTYYNQGFYFPRFDAAQ